MLGRTICLLFMFQLSFKINPGLIIGGTIHTKKKKRSKSMHIITFWGTTRCPMPVNAPRFKGDQEIILPIEVVHGEGRLMRLVRASQNAPWSQWS